MWASGEVVSSEQVAPERTGIVLPDEVLPSDTVNERMLDAVLVREGE